MAAAPHLGTPIPVAAATAGRPAAAGGGTPTSVRDELSNIRSEVAQVSQLSQQERDLLRSYGTQITALRKDILLVKKQTDFEEQRKIELEAMLNREREENIPPEHLEAIRRREQDIEDIRQEKAAMMEWLQRGVSEAQRISLQVDTLKAGTEAAHATESELKRDEKRLEQMKERLGTEIEEANSKILKMKETIASLEEHAEHQGSLTTVTYDILKNTTSDVDRLSSEAEALRKRAREVETIEISVGCLAASVRRAQHTLESLHNATIRGEEPPGEDEDGYDSEDDADDTNLSQVVMSSTKAKIGRCDALLVTLWSSLKTFEQDQRSRTHHNMLQHQQTVEKMQQENVTMASRLKEDLSMKQKEAEERIPQLQRFIQLRHDAVEKGYADGGGDYGPDGFNLLAYIDVENKKLLSENGSLRTTYETLLAKTNAMEEDYGSVKEMKRRYRDLEAQKTVLSHSIKEAEGVNREIKFFFHEESGSNMGPGSDMKGSLARRNNKTKAKPAWRATSNEPSGF